jgi:poly(hydroxyalkanoate) granule-associated protein
MAQGEASMPKKLKRDVSDKQFAELVSESANQIWLAGLAAFEKAQKEGWKVFEGLVKEGEKVEAKTRKVAEERISEVKQGATGTWDKLEQVFENRVERALASLGVPSRNDVAELSKRVEELSRAVSAYAEGKPTVSRSARRSASKASASGEADDLKQINGIGPALERKLNDAGITRFDQIASWSEAEVAEIENNVLKRSGRVAREDWIAQAKRATAERQVD